MEMQNRKSNKPFIITIVILVLIILAGAAYLLFFQKKDDSTPKDNNTTKTDDTTMSAPVMADIKKEATTNTKDTPLGKLECVDDKEVPEASYCKIESTKIRNARNGITYTLTELDKDYSLDSSFEKLAKVTIDENDAKEVKVAFNKEIVERYYATDGYSFTISVSFDREVKSTKVAGFGQGVGDEYILFVMKDGKVYYLRVSTMLKDRNFNPRWIKGVENVETILGGGSYDEHTGGHTNFAVRSDQTAYDLMTLLPSWGIEE